MVLHEHPRLGGVRPFAGRHVGERMDQLLWTALGERVMQPDFGESVG
jgi:phage baseplate assembly protein W